MKKRILIFIGISLVLMIAFVTMVAAVIMFGGGDNSEMRVVRPALRPSIQSARTPHVPEVTVGVGDGRAAVSTGDTGQSEGSESILEPSIEYYDVPLSEELQNHIFELCDLYEIEPIIVFAVIGKESMYDADVIGDNGRAFGLMQVQPRWHEDRIESLGVSDLLDPYQNVQVGIDYLAELFARGNSVEWTLMAYNGGFAHADWHANRGTVSEYVEDVWSISEGLR